MLKRSYLLFFYLMFSATTWSQFSIQGRLLDDSKHPLSGPTITLKQQDKAPISKVSDAKGRFSFSGLMPAEFSLTISGVGFDTYQNDFNFSSDLMVLDDIVLKRKATVLANVQVKVNNGVVIKEDTVSYSVDSFKTKPNAMAEDLLKKLPGVSVDKDGNVTAQGKQVTRVKVNGKDFFGGDVKTATREIPVELIDKVQVIDDYGDQASLTGIKDGDPEKVLNLQLKKDKTKGYFGNASLGAGTRVADDQYRYTASGTLHYFNGNQQWSLMGNTNNINTSLFNFSAPGSGKGAPPMPGGRSGGGLNAGTTNQMGQIMSSGDQGFVQAGSSSSGDGISDLQSVGINYSDQWSKKLSVYGSYIFTDKSTSSISNSVQQTLFQNYSNTNTQNSNQITSGANHRVFFNMEYKMDSLNYFKFSPQFSYRNSNTNTLSDFAIANAGAKSNDGTSRSLSGAKAPNLQGTLLYNHRFKKRGRYFSINLSGGNNSTDQTDDAENESVFYTGGTSMARNQHQYIDQQTDNSNYSARLSYNEPLSLKSNLEFNYQYSYQYTSNQKETYLYNAANTLKTYLDSLSNDFDNTYITQRFGINYRHATKKFNYTLGLVVQPGSIESNSFMGNGVKYRQTLFNVLPVAKISYVFSRSRSLDISYNARNTQPSATQLQVAPDYSNQQYIVVGNPNLKPEFSNTLSLRYNNFDFIKGEVLFTNLSFSLTNDKIVYNTINKGSGIQETRYLNDDGYYSINGFYFFSKPYKNRKYVLGLNGLVNFNRNISFVDSVRNLGKNLVINQGVKLDVTLKEWLEVGASVTYAYNSNVYSLSSQAATTTNSYILGSNAKLYLPGNFILGYDVEKTFNTGFSSTATANPFIINSSLEKQFFKKKNASIKLQALDMLNENTSVTRTVSGNSITDSRNNRLGRYYLLTLSYRISKFNGKQPQMMGPPKLPAGGEGGMRPPGF